jgi:GT2 family glycosyltransferase
VSGPTQPRVRPRGEEPSPGPHRVAIPPVEAGVVRPLWSVMIPTYECAAYLRETLASVLAQDPGPERMQIQVVDDHSMRDDPEAVVRELGRGRVEFHRQPENVGHSRNFDTCLLRARGHLVHLLHGDDCVREGFYERMERVFEARPDVGAAFCRVVFIDEAGRWKHVVPPVQPESGELRDRVPTLVTQAPVYTPAMVVRREAYERLGGFDRRLRVCGEDLEMWVRIGAHYPVWFEAEPLALYRKHGSSLSGGSVRSGENIRDTRFAFELFRPHLPAGSADRLLRRARRKLALWALLLAGRMVQRGDLAAARTQVREALRSSLAPIVLRRATAVALAAMRRGAGLRLRALRGGPGRRGEAGAPPPAER